MRAPNFMQLAHIDDQHFIAACRHGLVHLTWERATIRFSRDELRQLAGLLERAVDARLASVLQEGEIRVIRHLNQNREVQVGSSGLLLSSGEFQALVEAVTEAVRRLDEILASGVWDQEPEPPQVSFLEQLRRASFSEN
jgi:hypothetical protein